MSGSSAIQIRMEERAMPRHRIVIDTSIRRRGGETASFRIENFASSGCAGKPGCVLQPNDEVVIDLPVVGDARAVVAWSRMGRIGMAFFANVDAETIYRALAED